MQLMIHSFMHSMTAMFVIIQQTEASSVRFEVLIW